MTLEEVVEFEVFPPIKSKLLCRPSRLSLAGWIAAIYSGRPSAAFEAVAAEIEPPASGYHSASTDDLGQECGEIALVPIPGRGGGSPAFPRHGGSQIRRTTGPSVRPAASCHSSNAWTGQSSVLPQSRGIVAASVCRLWFGEGSAGCRDLSSPDSRSGSPPGAAQGFQGGGGSRACRRGRPRHPGRKRAGEGRRGGRTS